MRDVSGPVVVMRYNMYTAASITGNPAPGTGSQQAVDQMQQIASASERVIATSAVTQLPR